MDGNDEEQDSSSALTVGAVCIMLFLALMWLWEYFRGVAH